MIADVHNLSLLGSGGFADVYVGTLRRTGETVAVKVLRDARDPETRRLFAREARILARRVSRYVIPILGGDLDAEAPYYIMPFASGGALLDRAGRIRNVELTAFASQLAAAVGALHEAEIVHGDIKPDNVLLVGPELRVSDPLGNGGGCTLSFSTKLGGTPGYMAPELCRGGAISKEGDVFAFGATLFHLLTGVRPHSQPDLDPARLKRVDPVLRSVVLAAVHADPASRPTIHQVNTALTSRFHVLKQRESDLLLGGIAIAAGLVCLAALFGRSK